MCQTITDVQYSGKTETGTEKVKKEIKKETKEKKKNPPNSKKMF